jgi:hypothetical protein
MGKQHVAILLASERSGSTVFMRTLKNQGIHAIDEVFHPQRAWDLKLYPEVMRIATEFTGLNDSENFEIEASKFLRHQTAPVDFLLEIEKMAVCTGSHYFFSLFPSHLCLQQLAAICSQLGSSRCLQIEHGRLDLKSLINYYANDNRPHYRNRTINNRTRASASRHYPLCNTSQSS